MSLIITTVQTDIHWENISANLEMFTSKIESIQGKTEVVVLPEMFSTGFSMNTALAEPMNGSAVTWMKQIACKQKIVLIGSIMISENEKYFNRLICMLPNGEYGYYNKRHLFSYASEDQYFTPGNKRFICSVKGWKINLQICYDLRFPVWARQSNTKPEPEYDVLINVANWPKSRVQHWNTLLVARAIENQCFVIGVNRTGTDGQQLVYDGSSTIIGPLGNILYKKENDEDIFTTTLRKPALEKVRSSFPFLNDADHFIIQS